MKRNRRSDIIISGMKEKIREEIHIETMDKKQQSEDGIDISESAFEDFQILSRLLYKEVNYFKKWISAEEIRELLNYVDDQINEAYIFVYEFYIAGEPDLKRVLCDKHKYRKGGE